MPLSKIDRLREAYFEFILLLIEFPSTDFSKTSYNEEHYMTLLRILYETEYHITVVKDERRGDDVIGLRTDYSNLYAIDPLNNYAMEAMVDWKISVLEVWVALATRIGEEVVPYSITEFRPSTELFWAMLFNTGWMELPTMRDTRLAITKYSNRLIDAFGNGGPFPLVSDEYTVQYNQRETDIWMQCQLWLGQNYDTSGRRDVQSLVDLLQKV